MSNIIAHTQSQKPIYSAAARYQGKPGHYGDLNRVLGADLELHVRRCCVTYSRQDHLDAAAAHQAAADAIDAPPPVRDPGGLSTRKWRHHQAAQGHRLAAGGRPL